MDIVRWIPTAPLRRRPLPFSPGLTRRHVAEEEANVDRLLEQGHRVGAYDDGTLHVLDAQLDARRTVYRQRIELQEAEAVRRVAARVAKAAARAEGAHAAMVELETRLARVHAAFEAVDTTVHGSGALPTITAAHTPLHGPVQLDRHTLRTRPVVVDDPDAPSAQITPIRWTPEDPR